MKKIIILTGMAVTYFLPAIILMERYQSANGAIAWLIVGWVFAFIVGAILEY